MSKYMGSLGLRGLSKVGDILIPAGDGWPSFSQLGCAEHVDRVVEDLPPSDRDGVGLLFGVFYFVPGFLLVMLFNFLERNHAGDIFLGSVLRQIRMGVRGIVYSLYYSGWKGAAFSGKSPLELMDFKLTVIRD